jgi:hypothetical protein
MHRLIAAAVLGCTLAAAARADDGPGRALYLDGANAEAMLMDGAVRVAATRFACAGCHGADARGGGEGATAFPSLEWAVLSDPARPGGAYDEALFFRAVTEGVAADGRILTQAMPRYAVAPEVLGDLVAYLDDVDANQTRGVTPAAIAISASHNGAARKGLVVAAQAFNAAGGAFGRQLEIVDAGPALLDDAALASLLDPRIRKAEDDLRQGYLRALAAGSGGAGPDAELIIAALGQPIAPADGRGAVHVLSVAERYAGPAIDAGLNAESFDAYLHGILLGEAVIACGRRLTRACVEKGLAEINIGRFLQVYGPQE